MTITRTALALLCTWGTLAPHAQAASYPERTVTLTVPYGAGGSTDGIAREFARLLGQELKQSVVVLNQPGATGTLQLGNLARARPDGYTIGFYSYSTVTFTSQLMKVPYKRDDFTPLGGVAEFSYGIVTAPDSPINNVKDLVAQSKTPKGVFYGVTGAPNNFPFLQLHKLTGGKFDQVTYKSSAESITAVMGKHVDVALQGPSEYAELVRAGKLKFIASASDFRLPWFPQVPTIKEQGYDIGITGIIGVAAPKGIPEDARKTLEAAVQKVVASKPYADFLANEYGIKNYPASSAEFAKLIDQGFVRMADMIKTFDIKH
ncbi:tripartite tricarboxylate transporter substrate binding protein [Ramlibacter rhizophilus]|nr:tripartite tricarboxylate transporter substrate binding protein [Ramlibacter rhizophilus]